MTAKQPTPQGISTLLRKAGFDRAVITNNSRHVKEHTEGFRVRKHPGGVMVTHWSESVPPTSRTTAYAQREREFQRDMLYRYAGVIDAAGWKAEVSDSLLTLLVYPLLAAKDGDT